MTCQTDALATVYAKSLFELASDAGGNDKVVEIADELEQVCELMQQNSETHLFFTSPIIDVPKRGETLSAIFSNRVTDLTLRFLLVLNNKGRLNHLESISVAFDLLVQEAFGRVEVDVFTPTALDADAMNIIKGKVQSMLGKVPVLHPYVDKQMLGGLKLRIGDQLIDGSVQTKLRRLSESIKNSGGTAIREQFETYLEDN
ncbi:MAG: ATP synthase F1 subunit delta [Phycisphaerae bacterium]|nr:ATP synthase F1 subunit delta [Phycisphaerae bacterium]